MLFLDKETCREGSHAHPLALCSWVSWYKDATPGTAAAVLRQEAQEWKPPWEMEEWKVPSNGWAAEPTQGPPHFCMSCYVCLLKTSCFIPLIVEYSFSCDQKHLHWYTHCYELIVFPKRYWSSNSQPVRRWPYLEIGSLQMIKLRWE